MKRKYIIFFMHFFTSICLVSVGFASWTFVSGDSITAEGNIVAQDIHAHENYVDLAENGIEIFRYCDTGFLVNTEETFVDKDNNVHYHQEITSTGTLKLTYDVDVANFYNNLNSQESLVVTFTLSHIAIGEYNIISDYLTTTKITLNNEELTKGSALEGTNYTLNNLNNICTIQIDFKEVVSTYQDGDNATIELVIEHTFDTSEANFLKDVFPCFNNSYFEFIQKVDVELE